MPMLNALHMCDVKNISETGNVALDGRGWRGEEVQFVDGLSAVLQGMVHQQ